MAEDHKKCLLIVIDGVGCGEMPDAGDFGDAGANTLGNLAQVSGGLELPNLQKMGLGNIIDIKSVEPLSQPESCYGKMAEISPAKDSTVGHWELMGHPLKQPFPTYPNGFPTVIVEKLENRTGRKFIGNKTASGSEIIKELGAEHIRTGAPILYTSADSVLQIAAHEEIVPLQELYDICKTARGIMTGEHSGGRIIARPFIGKKGNFIRTSNRHDFSLTPPKDTVLDLLGESGIKVIGVGKIFDLFGGKGIQRSHPAKSNFDGIRETIKISREENNGLIFINLVDFDMLWGHRNNPYGFYQGLREFDSYLPEIRDTLSPEDVLIITADHGVDPTTESTDHFREYVPLIIWGPSYKQGIDLGLRKSFADVGATVSDFFGTAGT